MALELESHYLSLMANKGRSASICAPGTSGIETFHHINNGGSGNLSSIGSTRRKPCAPRELPDLSQYSARGSFHRTQPQPQEAVLILDRGEYSRDSGNIMQISNSGTPTRARKHGAHRSQSARVVGSSRPKVKRRERDIVQDYQHHLDLASSEGAIGDCQESYNPFLAKVPSSGRLITSASLEMSCGSLYGTPPPPPPAQLPLHGYQSTPPLSGTPRDSPKILRRHSGGGPERRGSDKSNPDTERMIPMIGVATPDTSPNLLRRSGTTKPSGLPKSPTVSRSSSARRVNSYKGPRRNNNSYLDVPDSNPSPDDEDEDSYRLRSFSISPKGKGIVNRGDSFRRRRSRSNSLIPTPTTPESHRHTTFTSEDGYLLPKSFSNEICNRSPSPRCSSRNKSHSPAAEPENDENISNYRVAMVGARGVGKAALVSQFMTSEGIDAYDRQNDVEGEETVSVMLNGEESELTFFKVNNLKTEVNRLDPPDAFVIVYSVVDRSSFQKAETELRRLQEYDFLRSKAVVLVANKIDLARSRAVSTQDGRILAVSFRVKFVEVSVGINHNVDELLVGLLHQIRLKSAHAGNSENWCKHKGILRASVKARQVLTWLLGKEDSKFKNCENLHIL